MDALWGVIPLEDGTMVVAGESDSGVSGDKTLASKGGYDYWVLKLDNSGNILWQNVYGGSQNDRMRAFEATADGGFLINGHSLSGISGDKTEPNNGLEDYWAVKIDSEGNLEWEKTLGGSGPDFGHAIAEASDGSVFVGGGSASGVSGDKTEPLMGSSDVWMAKLSSEGELLWENTIGGDGGDTVYQTIPTPEGGLVLGATSSSNISGDKTEDSRGLSDIWMLEIDAMGNILWQKTVGGSGIDVAQAIIQTADNNFIIASDSTSPISGDKTEASVSYDYWMVKLDATGTILDQNVLQAEGIDIPLGVELAHGTGYVVVGYSDSDSGLDKEEDNQGFWDIWVNYLDLPLGVNEVQGQAKIEVFPNPVSNVLFVKSESLAIESVGLYNLLGQAVYYSNLLSHTHALNVDSLTKGLYYLRVQTTSGVLSQQIVVK